MVYYDFQALSSSGFSGQSETECTSFAQDQHAFAVIPNTNENQTAITCLAQNHVVDLYNIATYLPTPQDFSAYRGYLYQPAAISPYRFGSFIHLLAQYGYFGSGAKVGILLADDGSGNNEYLVNKLWKPALQAMGITPVVFTFKQIESYTDVTTTSEQFASAVLQFKGAGVNRVMFTPDGADGEFFFTNAAQSQNYQPRYALTTDNAPLAWGVIPPAGQRAGAMNVSFKLSDVGRGNPPQMAPNDTRAKCNAILSGHTGNDPITAFYFICDDFLFLQNALAGASTVSPQTLLAGVERLGNSYSLADSYTNAGFGPPDHYDGGASVRVMGWDVAANAWQYVSPPEAVPWA
jgi:hypothetical protein